MSFFIICCETVGFLMKTSTLLTSFLVETNFVSKLSLSYLYLLMLVNNMDFSSLICTRMPLLTTLVIEIVTK